MDLVQSHGNENAFECPWCGFADCTTSRVAGQHWSHAGKNHPCWTTAISGQPWLWLRWYHLERSKCFDHFNKFKLHAIPALRGWNLYVQKCGKRDKPLDHSIHRTISSPWF